METGSSSGWRLAVSTVARGGNKSFGTGSVSRYLHLIAGLGAPHQRDKILASGFSSLLVDPHPR